MLTAIIKWTAICGLAAIVVLTQSATGFSDDCWLCSKNDTAPDMCEWHGFCFEPGTYLATSDCTCGCYCDPDKLEFICKKAKGEQVTVCEFCADTGEMSCNDGTSSLIFIDRGHCRDQIDDCLYSANKKVCAPEDSPCSMCPPWDNWCILLHKKASKLGIVNTCYLDYCCELEQEK